MLAGLAALARCSRPAWRGLSSVPSKSRVGDLSADMLVSVSMGHGHSSTTHDGLVRNLRDHGVVQSPAVERALFAVDRAWFIPAESVRGDVSEVAYQDKPVGLGLGTAATISSPYSHALALEALARFVAPEQRASGEACRVLDVGCGSGYVTACLLHMALGEEQSEDATVSVRAVGMDIEPALVDFAQLVASTRLPSSLASRLQFACANAYESQGAQFDCIHVGAAVEAIPDSLVEQLAPGGGMLIPVLRDAASGSDEQGLVLLSKAADNSTTSESLMSCVYSPLHETRPEPVAEAPDAKADAAAASSLQQEIDAAGAALREWQAAFRQANNDRRPTAQEIMETSEFKRVQAAKDELKQVERRLRRAQSP